MKNDLLIFLTGCLLFSCTESAVENGPTPAADPFAALPGDSVVVPVTTLKSEVRLLFYEEIDTASRPVELTFFTKKEYGGGHFIAGSIVRSGDHFTIALDSVYMPGGGPGITIPASINFRLGPLPNAVYGMTVKMNGMNVEALLLVSDTSYIVKIQPNNYLSATRSRLLRVPAHAVWGQAESYTPVEHQLFIDSLKGIGARKVPFTTGDYHYFKVFSADSFSTNSMMGYRHGQFFLMMYDGNTAQSKNLVKRFAKRYLDSLYVRLTGGRGEMLYTTVLRYEP
jgi:hypothetical protein